MILYLEPSAFLKLYLDEAGSAAVRTLLDEATGVFTHAIAYVEMRGGLARAVRQRRLTDDVLAEQRKCFESDWARLRIIEASLTLLRSAGELAEAHGLRAYDSVHLAAAQQLAQQLSPGTPFRFGVFDHDLREAARRIGLTVAP